MWDVACGTWFMVVVCDVSINVIHLSNRYKKSCQNYGPSTLGHGFSNSIKYKVLYYPRGSNMFSLFL